MSTAVVSGGFPNLYRTDVSGAPVDELADRAVARADVAELLAELTPAVKVEPEHHLINVAAKRALTATEFKQMFYARGDDHFELANVYECHNIASNILASVWGKRLETQAVGTLRTNVVKMSTASTLLGFEPGISPPYYFSTITLNTIIFFTSFSGITWTNVDVNIPYYVVSVSSGAGSNTTMEISDTIGGTAIPMAVTGTPGTATTGTIQWGDSQALPYNTSRVINYNRLGGRPDDPSGVDMAYGYATDLQRTFFAQFEVMGNLEKDLCVKRDDWTLCSRINIEDQLYGLAFVAEDCDDICMKVSCARKWSEVEDALAESCLAENNTIGYDDIVDLYINVRVTNANTKAMDTIIRIRFPVKLTRGPDDLGNWNVVASNAADAVLTTGIPYDSVEGGNMQYANASQTEKQANDQNQQQTQLPTSTAPGNSNNSTDPHDGVPLI
jgi:hypothetical protein